MAWIESHQTLGQHPKTRKLAHLLGVSKPAAIGHLHCLWWWAVDYAEDGDLSRFDALDIAIGAEWDGDETEFVTAMVKAGFLDEGPGDTFAVHDWDDYAGKLIERKKANAKRMREARAERDTGTETPRAEHVQRTQRARVERPNQTIPNQTKPDRTEEEKGADAPDPTPKPANKPNYSTDFESFWQTYPSGHGVKKTAWDQWQKIRPGPELVREILDGLNGWHKSDRWLSGFVMDAHRWLRERAWESVPPPQSSNVTRLSAPRRTNDTETVAAYNRDARERAKEIAHGRASPVFDVDDEDVIETHGRIA